MRRVIGIILIISVLLSVLGTGITASADYEFGVFTDGDISFSINEVNPGEEIEVSVCVHPYVDVEIGSIEFSISCNYVRGYSYPFNLVPEKVQLPDEFASAAVAQSSYDVPIKYVWESVDNVILKAYETVTLGTFTLKVHEKAALGEYDFSLYFDVFSCFSVEQGEFIDFPVYIPEGHTVFVGEKLTLYNSIFYIPCGGAENYAYYIYTNKLIDHENTYIFNTDVAEIVGIEDYEDYSGIKIRGKKIGGSTGIFVSGMDEDLYETVTASIKVEKPSVVTVVYPVTEPNKTVYYVGEKCDKETLLNGLSVTVCYDNYEIETISDIDAFTLGEIDTKTPGKKRVKVQFADTYIFLEYEFKEAPQISSDVYMVDLEYVYDVPQKTSIEDFRKNIKIDGDIKIYDENNNEVTEGIIKTGMRVVFEVGDIILQEREIAVKYDINGDGKASVKDLFAAKKKSVNLETFEGVYIKAAGIDIPNAKFLIDMKNYLLNLD